jgi:hypothetical protein
MTMSAESTAATEVSSQAPPAKPRTVIMSRPSGGGRMSALPHLLKVADGYYAAGRLRQAAGVYFEILGKQADSPEADRARERLLEIAQRHEQANEPHQARSIYERLL